MRMMIGVVEHDGDEHKAGGMAAGGAVKASAATKNHISDRDGGLGKSIVGVVFIIVVFCFLDLVIIKINKV